jgi:hypothetical protein
MGRGRGSMIAHIAVITFFWGVGALSIYAIIKTVREA